MKKQEQIPVTGYRAAGFIGEYQKLVRETVIPYQYAMLGDPEKSHVIQNFVNAGKALRGEDTGDGFKGMVFQDSDAAKWIEAAAYCLAECPDPELEKTVDELIDIIAAAQDEDGYLDTCFTVKDKDRRWKNLLEAHELYCAGHMMEAACAYHQVTGKDKLLGVMLKNVEHIYKHFVAEGNEGCPGHPEVELALLKMYRETGDKRCLELAGHFIDSRGQNPHFYEEEAARRDWTVWGANPSDYDYMQSGKPVREQTDATGHAVRAVYLYTAMADLASETGDKALFAACRRLWSSITEKRMYVTGGIGSTVLGEAFSVDYDLPPDTAYCESCASVGLMFFASRMLENCVDSRYSDIMELAFYNTVLAGMSADGKKFFYVNPLEVTPGISGVSPTHRHDLPERQEWFACACCPPNIARVISSFGQYAYGENSITTYCHLFAAGEVTCGNGMKFRCETEYPYGFTVRYIIEKGGMLAVRIPLWSFSHTIHTVTVNGSQYRDNIPERGYLYIPVRDGDIVTLTLDDSAKFVYASERVPALTGKAAIQRGPLVCCFEEVDNWDVLSLRLDTSVPPKVSKDGRTITAKAYREVGMSGLYGFSAPAVSEVTATAVPYYSWGNRGLGQMRVWLPY